MIWRLQTLAIAGAIGLAALGAWTVWNRHDAAADVVEKIRGVNDAISSGAISARLGVAACRNAGGVWDFADLECRQSE